MKFAQMKFAKGKDPLQFVIKTTNSEKIAGSLVKSTDKQGKFDG